ncbi:unnamed protein product [Rotaria socialis]|uniref:Uncharacterized protein n=1 Tax=Rotaria socialis TaxID=392032 RepID=A0A817S2R5_9BILA|nr:unnamed protein product [Rotaria socialis]CAF3270142.1 unnamed protein product [Rotaria socialis]CAF3342695.1 unnamed protein product [Rotaria socialis]CAF3376409.1 unnamed protein product [Rotaria socialis]CAF3442617.1 unnamed protein product [Rotaria socialis]
MALQTSTKQRDLIHKKNDEFYQNYPHEYAEEIDETEKDLMENYLYLTQHCGVLRHSPTTSVLDTIQQQQQQHNHHQKLNQSVFSRQITWTTENHPLAYDRSFHLSQARSLLNDFSNNYHREEHRVISRIPPTIYYNVDDDDESGDRSFSLVKLFARMKARMTHDRRYKRSAKHELLHEDAHEWFELTKNVRDVLTKALLPDGGYDALLRQRRAGHNRRNSQKKSIEYNPVLSKDIEEDEENINIEIDDEMNTEGNKEFDLIIWNKFLDCSRGLNHRRCAVCKTVDRQQHQGQLMYIYGVANNILIDENLKASGLG